MKARKIYIGFVEGRPFHEPFPPYGVKIIAAFTSRRAARKCFQDVREFVLVPAESPSTGKTPA